MHDALKNVVCVSGGRTGKSSSTLRRCNHQRLQVVAKNAWQMPLQRQAYAVAIQPFPTRAVLICPDTKLHGNLNFAQL